MTDSSPYRFQTLALHAGQQVDHTGARAMPIYQTTSYVFDSTAHAAGLFNLEQAGHIYSRISNPTVAAFEERMAALEGGAGALGTASGQSALFLALSTIVGAGEHIVSSSALYGGSQNLLANTLPRFGITTTFVDPANPQHFADAITDKTRLVFAETIGNPRINVLDTSAVAEVAHQAGLPLLVDNTFATPWLCRPIEHGADLIMHSATKFIGGHGTSIGGVLIDSGRFDWTQNDKFSLLTEPSAGYHGVTFSAEFGPLAFLMKARLEGLRDFGPCMSPMHAFYFLQGLETLPVRMERHVENTMQIAQYLTAHPKVSWVAYPGLADAPDHALAQQYLPRGCGAILAFGIQGGRQGGVKLIENLSLISHLANVGDAKTLIIHPASTTHQQMSAEAMEAGGVTEDLVRLSIGLEDVEDLKSDLEVALKRVG